MMVCPWCPRLIEDSEHVIKCRCMKSDEIWKRELKKVESAMTKLSILPETSRIIRQRFEKWRTGDNTRQAIKDQSLKAAIQDQDIIGWRGIIEGRWAKSWIQVLRKDHEVCELQRSPEVTNAQISKLWVELHFCIWEYRNKCVHRPGGWTEQQETPSLDREIEQEYANGSETLDGE